jgi:hypothetical protein
VPLVVYGALVGTLHLVGKTGEILAPTLAPSHPLVLLCLNANDTHMLLTSTSVRLLPYLLVGCPLPRSQPHGAWEEARWVLEVSAGWVSHPGGNRNPQKQSQGARKIGY